MAAIDDDLLAGVTVETMESAVLRQSGKGVAPAQE
jgi:hypothetical protein